MPWNYRPWGCGSGKKGSCNNGWIQFEICEGSLDDKDYFEKVYKEACEITAYLCDLYNLNPKGTVTVNGTKVPVILCHQDSYKLGFGSNHGDIYHWFKKHGKDMDDVRNDVAELMKDKTTTSQITPVLTPVSNNTTYQGKGIGTATSLCSMNIREKASTTGKLLGSIPKNTKVEVLEQLSSGWLKIVWTKSNTGYAYVSNVKNNYFTFKPNSYKVKITASTLNVRAGAGTKHKINTTVKKNEVYTIVAESNGWGKLKSGAGWISLAYTQKV